MSIIRNKSPLKASVDANIDNNIVYISGFIDLSQVVWDPNLHGYLVGTLPQEFKPLTRRIFMTWNHQVIRIDITPEGNIVVMNDNQQIESVNLTGIHFPITVGHQLPLFNGWRPFGKPYQYPSYSYHNSIICLRGVIRGGFPNCVFGFLPEGNQPSHKVIFKSLSSYKNGPNARIEILPTGQCFIFTKSKSNKEILGWYSLEGISFDRNQNKQSSYELPMIEHMTQQQYQQLQNYGYPSCNINGQIVHLNGFTQKNTFIPPQHAPSKDLIFSSPDVDNSNESIQINIKKSGEVIIKGSNPSKITCLNGISYIKNKPKIQPPIKNRSQQIGGADSGPQTATIGSTTLTSPGGPDGASNIQFIDLNSQIKKAGKITGWSANMGRVGVTLLQVYRLSNAQNSTYSLIGEYQYNFTKTGVTSVTIPSGFYIDVSVGDYIGWRYPEQGTINFINNSGNVKWLYGNSPGIGKLLSFTVGGPRTYGYSITIEYPLTQQQGSIINSNIIGGSSDNPARSAQNIVDDCQKKSLPYPTDGTYWINAMASLPPKQVYCNFSYRKGYGYMLISYVTDQVNWLSATSPSLPLDPHFSSGAYLSNGQPGNYYRQWDDLDINTILDKNPTKCTSFGYQYSSDGKFCGHSSPEGIARLNLEGGISEFMFATGNGKYWVIFPRHEIPGQVTKAVEKKIDLIDSSKNFDKTCNPQASVYIISRPGVQEDPWINAGDSHKCGNNYMFWGMNNYNAYQTFKNQNGGIQLLIGGSPNKNPKKQSYPHNPSHHQAPGKAHYASTYKDAVSVCQLMGKKVCTKDELESANKAGYSSCACGWTDTKVGDKQWVGYPTNMNQWTDLNKGKEASVQGGWCGVPGMNLCNLVEKGQSTGWGPGGADIYCCDKFAFSSDFNLLDNDYLSAQAWILDVENLFNQMYGKNIPPPIDILIYNEDGFGVAVTKKGNTYELTNNDQGTPPAKLKNIRCQLPKSKQPGSDRLAIFLNDIGQQQIVRGLVWPLNTGKILTITYGSTICLENISNGNFLTTQNINYYHPKSGQKTQVMGTLNTDQTSQWLIKSKRGQGKLNNQGYGDETYNFGSPVKSGDIIRLQSMLSKKNLHSNVIYLTQSNNQEVYVDEQAQLGDSDDHWRLELISSDVWTPNVSFKLVHVNTNTVLFSNSTTYIPSPNSSLKYNEISTRLQRESGDTWKIQTYTIGKKPDEKCLNIIEQITKLTLQIKATTGTESESLKQQKKQLIDQYNSQCRNLSMFDYKNKMDQEANRIKILNDTLTQDSNKLSETNAKMNQTETQKSTDKKTYTLDYDEYQKLVNKCTPVKKCVKGPNKGSLLPGQCQSILGPLQTANGQITPELAALIKSILVDTDSVTKYDIRDHPDFYQLIENNKINSCPK